MHDLAETNNHPENERAEMALGRCLVDGDLVAASRARRARRKSFVMSLGIEFLLLVSLVAAPLLSSGAQLQLHQILPPQITFSSPWKERPPEQRVLPPTTAFTPSIPNPYVGISVPHPIMEDRPVTESAEVSVPDMPGEYPQGAIQVIGPSRTSLFVEPPHVAQPAQPAKQPVKFSEGLIEAQLISRIEPQYPTLARLTKTEGTVRLHAIISRDGRITSLDVISGHPLLVQAALDAVRQWRYRPTMLNGEPVEVETSITVIFRMRPQ
jgi:protein TonB